MQQSEQGRAAVQERQPLSTSPQATVGSPKFVPTNPIEVKDPIEAEDMQTHVGHPRWEPVEFSVMPTGAEDMHTNLMHTNLWGKAPQMVTHLTLSIVSGPIVCSADHYGGQLDLWGPLVPAAIGGGLQRTSQGSARPSVPWQRSPRPFLWFPQAPRSGGGVGFLAIRWRVSVTIPHEPGAR